MVNDRENRCRPFTGNVLRRSQRKFTCKKCSDKLNEEFVTSCFDGHVMNVFDSNEKHNKSQEKKEKLLYAEKLSRKKIEKLEDSHQREINEHKAKISEVLIELESLKDYKAMYKENLKQTGKQKSDSNSKSRKIVSLKQQINSLEGKERK